MDLEWMAWTPFTAVFFITIFLMLLGMTTWQMIQPSVTRRGFLPIATTRGDRLFIGLLCSGYIHLAWLGLTEMSLYIATGIALVWIIVVMRWG